MKNILTIICFGTFVSGFASNGTEKLAHFNSKFTEVLTEKNTLEAKGLCTGSVVVIGSDGRQKTLDMTSVVTDTALDCSDKFIEFLKETRASYTVVSFSSNYNEEGVK